MVPKIMGAAPNTPATGSHTDVQTKRNPNRVIAGQALAPSSKTSASRSSGSDSARPVSAARYSRSPVLRPRSRGRAWVWECDGCVVGGSMGSVVIGRKRLPRGYRVAVVHTDLPPAVMLFKRVSIQGLSCLGSGA